jgi:hypothetical protein
MFNFVRLIRESWGRLAASITLEQGETFTDARGDVLRGLQVAETVCGITTQMTSEVLEVSKELEMRNYREPLGAVAAICPFSKDPLNLNERNSLSGQCGSIGSLKMLKSWKNTVFFCNCEPATRTLIESVAVT